MDVVVAGGHGQVALRLLRRLAEAGHRARGVIRDPPQASDLEAAGAEAIVCDLERDDLTGRLGSADAVVFAAGAGPGSGPERKRTVDLGGALKLIDAARADGVSRYVMVSAMGAADPTGASEQMRPYIEAKAEADRALADSGLDFTIVRPGRLTDGPGTGLVEVGRELGRRGEISREDTAAVLAAVLEAPGTVGKTFEVLAGETPIEDALRSL
jgi:nucleoside-diphosphate-sugar epimerase